MSERKRPSRPKRLVLIGCGRAARGHLRAISYFEKRGLLSLAGLVDRDERAIEEVIRARPSTWPRPRSADRLSALDTDGSFDIAVIATPPLTHAPLALEALESGMHLVVEKPLTLDLGEAGRLVEEAKARGRMLAVGLKYRYIPGIREIQALIQSGHFGPVLYGATSVRWGHDQAYYDQATWFGTWEAEGGALLNQSIHGLDLMTWLMGTRPLEATAVLARQSHDMEAADWVSGTLSMENNSYLLLEGTTNTDPAQQEASFFLRCTGGTVRASFGSGKRVVSVRSDGGKELFRQLIFQAIRHHVKREGLGVLRQLGNPYTFLYADLLDAIETDGNPLAPGEAGRDALAHALAILQAGRDKRTVPCPPQAFQLSQMAGFFD